MDPLSASRVNERTLELQRTADQLRQERDLRSTSSPQPTMVETRPAEARLARTGNRACTPAEPAI